MAAAVEEMPQFFPTIRDKAIITHGDQESLTRAVELFDGYGLPNGLLPLKKIVEGGWVEETGFTWMVTEETQKHHFDKADRECRYDELISCTISAKKMTDIHGVKAKELGLWVPINEICVDEKNPDKIIFKSIVGLSRSFPASHFVINA
ncbi:hypothetical protein GOP47_0030450 [Adiantum capillus-veneris]|nr:hypothetical protein GOP47_0030450 [Adiantum capillus-veneris]